MNGKLFFAIKVLLSMTQEALFRVEGKKKIKKQNANNKQTDQKNEPLSKDVLKDRAKFTKKPYILH